jgi:hypothetical protein
MNTTDENVVRLAIDNPIITHEELAALEFEPSSRFVGFDQSPKELIESVRGMDEKQDEEVNSMNFLGYLTDAREKTEAILSFLTAAEIRHACAMANVYAGDEANLPPIPTPEKPTLGGPKRGRPH